MTAAIWDLTEVTREQKKVKISFKRFKQLKWFVISNANVTVCGTFFVPWIRSFRSPSVSLSFIHCDVSTTSSLRELVAWRKKHAAKDKRNEMLRTGNKKICDNKWIAIFVAVRCRLQNCREREPNVTQISSRSKRRIIVVAILRMSSSSCRYVFRLHLLKNNLFKSCFISFSRARIRTAFPSGRSHLLNEFLHDEGEKRRWQSVKMKAFAAICENSFTSTSVSRSNVDQKCFPLGIHKHERPRMKKKKKKSWKRTKEVCKALWMRKQRNKWPSTIVDGPNGKCEKCCKTLLPLIIFNFRKVYNTT